MDGRVISSPLFCAVLAIIKRYHHLKSDYLPMMFTSIRVCFEVVWRAGRNTFKMLESSVQLEVIWCAL